MQSLFEFALGTLIRRVGIRDKDGTVLIDVDCAAVRDIWTVQNVAKRADRGLNDGKPFS